MTHGHIQDRVDVVIVHQVREAVPQDGDGVELHLQAERPDVFLRPADERIPPRRVQQQVRLEVDPVQPPVGPPLRDLGQDPPGPASQIQDVACGQVIGADQP